MSRGLLLVVLLACCAPAPASAIAAWQPVTPPTDRALTGTRTTENLRIALDFLDREDVPMPCDVRVYEATPEQMTAFTGVAAAGATFLGPLVGECPIWRSSTFAAPTIENRIDACDTDVHEILHAAFGYEHDTDPDSLMNPDAEVTVWGCYQRYIGRGGRAWRATHPGNTWARRP